MRFHKLAGLSLASCVLLAACSQTETTRSDDIESSDAEAAPEAEPLTPEQQRFLSTVEERFRDDYESRHFEMTSFELAPDGPDRFSGPVELFDRLLNERSTVDCEITLSDGQVTNAACEDRNAPSERAIVSNVEMLVRGETAEEVRDELLNDMPSALGGNGRTSVPVNFEGVRDSFTATFRTTSADGSESWQSGCAGEIRRSEDGSQVAAYLCRQRP